MNASERGTLFISHGWQFERHYWELIAWLQEEPLFSCCVPHHVMRRDTESINLKEELTQQIRPAQAVIILSGLYQKHRFWLDYTITEALNMNKPIIGVYSWRKEATPENILKATTMPMVIWDRLSIVQAVNKILLEPKPAPPSGSSPCHNSDTVPVQTAPICNLD
ncbi:TIR domain-containing protein, partial [Desulfobulbus sp. US2]|nr:TIR domain-containing protein [Desulfobulbus sp. US2]